MEKFSRAEILAGTFLRSMDRAFDSKNAVVLNTLLSELTKTIEAAIKETRAETVDEVTMANGSVYPLQDAGAILATPPRHACGTCRWFAPPLKECDDKRYQAVGACRYNRLPKFLTGVPCGRVATDDVYCACWEEKSTSDLPEDK